jgi:septation ring formation regulator EzrA
MQYYKAYSEKLEQRLHRVREERDFVAKKLENSQKAFSTLRQQASSLGRKLLECAGLESTRSVGAKEGAQEMLSILKQDMLYLGETLLEYTGLGPAADENGDLDNYIPFSILAT